MKFDLTKLSKTWLFKHDIGIPNRIAMEILFHVGQPALTIWDLVPINKRSPIWHLITFDLNTHYALMMLLVNIAWLYYPKENLHNFFHSFWYLFDKNGKIWRIYKNVHSVYLLSNSENLGHFQTWHPPIYFLKHIKLHYEHGCQNVLEKMPTIFFFRLWITYYNMFMLLLSSAGRYLEI